MLKRLFGRKPAGTAPGTAEAGKEQQERGDDSDTKRKAPKRRLFGGSARIAPAAVEIAEEGKADATDKATLSVTGSMLAVETADEEVKADGEGDSAHVRSPTVSTASDKEVDASDGHGKADVDTSMAVVSETAKELPESAEDGADERKSVDDPASLAPASAAPALPPAPPPLPVSASSVDDEADKLVTFGAAACAASSPSPAALPSPVGQRVQVVSAGAEHVIAVLSSGVVMTAGSNAAGQLGRSGGRAEVGGSDAMRRVDALEAFTVRHATAGDDFSAALTSDGRLLSWGGNAHGQLGVGDVKPRGRPRFVKELPAIAVIAAGGSHVCALTRTGLTYSWGSNRHGQLGRPCEAAHGLTPAVVPQLSSLPVVAIAAGKAHSLAVTAGGALFAWGANDAGQLGCGDRKPREEATAVRTLHAAHIVAVAAGDEHTLALSAAGAAFSCGCGGSGRLGHGSELDELRPKRIMRVEERKVTAVCAGAAHSLLLCDDGELWACGSNAAGQLGLGADGPPVRLTPKTLPSLPHGRLAAVAAGGDYSIALIAAYQPPVAAPLSLTLSSLRKAVDAVRASLRELCAVCGKLAVPVSRCAICGLPPYCSEACSSSDAARHHREGAREGEGKKSEGSCPGGPAAAAPPPKNTRPLARLQSLILEAFASAGVLNNSFLLPPPACYSLSPSQSGLDMAAVRSAYLLLTELRQSALRAALVTATQWLVKALASLQLDKAVNLRVLLVLLENPLLLLPGRYHSAILGTLAALSRLKADSRALLFGWLRRLPSEHFSRIVHVLQGYLSLAASRRDLAMQPAVVLLDELFRINVEADIVPYTLFYNEDVTNNVSLEEVYMKWRISSGFSLCNYPFLLTPLAKSQLLHVDAVMRMRESVGRELATRARPKPFCVITVRRSDVVADTLEQVRAIVAAGEHELRKPLKVMFAEEEGVDEGGVRKEFFQIAFQQLLDPAEGLFTQASGSRLLWLNHNCEKLEQLQTVGALLGLAVYNGVVVKLPLAPALYKLLASQPVALRDLMPLQPVLARSLQTMMDYDESTMDALGLAFEASLPDSEGRMHSHELKDGGSDIDVTADNREQFVELYVDFLLKRSVHKQYAALSAGFSSVMPASMLTLFRPEELELLVCGKPELGDLRELQAVTRYGGYSADSDVIRWFWKTVLAYPEHQQRRLLQFVTSSDCVPIGGLAKLRFAIQRSGDDSELLPIAHTCFHLLDLPEYSSEEKLAAKLQLALEHAEGFGLA